MAIEIHFVSGKGGVGKSSLAFALALAYAKKNKKTLLVELGAESFFQDALERPFSAQPTAAFAGVDLAVWNGSSCLREYALHLLKSEVLYKLFMQNSVSKTLIQIAPGLAELAMLGKITSGPPRNVGPKIPYDVMVVDAFSTGHFLALLRAPFGFSNAVRVGPMGEQTRSIIDVIRNPSICHYHLVGLAEELPLQETLELQKTLAEIVPTPAQLWLNRWVEDQTPANDRPKAFSDYLESLKKRQANAEEKFHREAKHLPWIFSSDFREVCQGMSEAIHV